jgi:hypothetical protein
MLTCPNFFCFRKFFKIDSTKKAAKKQRMGRKKIQITRISDERNRQVSVTNRARLPNYVKINL